jgi:hypothetical protein
MLVGLVCAVAVGGGLIGCAEERPPQVTDRRSAPETASATDGRTASKAWSRFEMPIWMAPDLPANMADPGEYCLMVADVDPGTPEATVRDCVLSVYRGEWATAVALSESRQPSPAVARLVKEKDPEHPFRPAFQPDPSLTPEARAALEESVGSDAFEMFVRMRAPWTVLVVEARRLEADDLSAQVKLEQRYCLNRRQFLGRFGIGSLVRAKDVRKRRAFVAALKAPAQFSDLRLIGAASETVSLVRLDDEWRIVPPASAREDEWLNAAMATLSDTLSQGGVYEKQAQSTCVSNMRELYRALRMYKVDHGALPPRLDGLVAEGATAPYVKDRQVYACPSDRTHASPSYGGPPELAGADTLSRHDPASTPMVVEYADDLRSIDPRHTLDGRRGSNWAFLDGRVEFIPEGDGPAVTGSSQAP